MSTFSHSDIETSISYGSLNPFILDSLNSDCMKVFQIIFKSQIIFININISYIIYKLKLEFKK